jgi:3'-5' exonuclease
MLHEINEEKILFLDIETVPTYELFELAPDNIQKLWSEKVKNQVTAEVTPASLYRRAGIFAEFGKIICISVGFISGSSFRVKSFAGHDEFTLLNEFGNLLSRNYSSADAQLCAHNGKEFDFPFMARRMLIHGISLPPILNLAGKKPWEVKLLDTMELWKFGDFKNFTSLNLLATVFGIPTPKDDIDGSMVYDVYYKEKDLDRIVVYCQKDVFTVAQIFRKLKGGKLLDPDQMVIT